MRYLLLALILPLAACGQPPKFSKAELADQETAFKSMMEIHDRAMPRLGEMNQLSRGLRATLEDPNTPDSTRQLVTQALQELETAEDGMMEWMGQVKMPNVLQAELDHPAILEYFNTENGKIARVESDINASIADAQALLNALNSPEEKH